MILEAIKDHLISHVAKKTRYKEIFDALVSLFRSDDMSRKIILKPKLKECKMNPSNNVTSYLMRITQICNQPEVIGEAILDVELVNITLNGFIKAWKPFIMGTCAHEQILKWEGFWNECIQEETRKEFRTDKQGKGEADENLALFSKMKKTNKKAFIKKGGNQGGAIVHREEIYEKRSNAISAIRMTIFFLNVHRGKRARESHRKLQQQQRQLSKPTSKFKSHFLLEI